MTHSQCEIKAFTCYSNRLHFFGPTQWLLCNSPQHCYNSPLSCGYSLIKKHKSIWAHRALGINDALMINHVFICIIIMEKGDGRQLYIMHSVIWFWQCFESKYIRKVDMPSFLSCSALSISSADGNVSGNVTISFCKQQLDKKLWENVSKIMLVA